MFAKRFGPFERIFDLLRFWPKSKFLTRHRNFTLDFEILGSVIEILTQIPLDQNFRQFPTQISTPPWPKSSGPFNRPRPSPESTKTVRNRQQSWTTDVVFAHPIDPASSHPFPSIPISSPFRPIRFPSIRRFRRPSHRFVVHLTRIPSISPSCPFRRVAHRRSCCPPRCSTMSSISSKRSKTVVFYFRSTLLVFDVISISEPSAAATSMILPSEMRPRHRFNVLWSKRPWSHFFGTTRADRSCHVVARHRLQFTTELRLNSQAECRRCFCSLVSKCD